jgi:hypothetical protein
MPLQKPEEPTSNPPGVPKVFLISVGTGEQSVARYLPDSDFLQLKLVIGFQSSSRKIFIQESAKCPTKVAILVDFSDANGYVI